uniref:alpha-L-fucosidase n=1 Tax=Bursaphelenchus xylophilus TaxID=6326 RepID=A0A1I7SDU3_BURXY
MNSFIIWPCILGLSLAYTPDWDSLDSRPLPAWYDADKFGIFCHWGVFSVPAYKSEWIWSYWHDNNTDVVNYMNKNFPGLSYADLGAKFTAADFNAETFASIIKSSGAKYFVITTKHHEGYTLWPSSTSFNWNSVDLGSHRDLVGELKEAIVKEDIHFGTYFSQFDWFHPLYLNDKNEATRKYPDQVSLVQMKELINNYKPDVLWSDGDWERGDFYWSSKEFLAWLFTDRSTFLVKKKYLYIFQNQTTLPTEPTSTFSSPLNQGECAYDVLLLIDSSGSVVETFEREKRLALDILGHLPISPMNVRVAIIKFSSPSKVRTLHGFNSVQTKAHVLKKLETIRMSSGTTAIHSALQHAVNEYSTSNGARSTKATPLVIVFTDGFGNKDFLKEATALRSQVPDLFAVAINHEFPISRRGLVAITGSTNKVFTEKSIDKLHSLLRLKLKYCWL